MFYMYRSAHLYLLRRRKEETTLGYTVITPDGRGVKLQGIALCLQDLTPIRSSWLRRAVPSDARHEGLNLRVQQVWANTLQSEQCHKLPDSIRHTLEFVLVQVKVYKIDMSTCGEGSAGHA